MPAREMNASARAVRAASMPTSEPSLCPMTVTLENRGVVAQLGDPRRRVDDEVFEAQVRLPSGP